MWKQLNLKAKKKIINDFKNINDIDDIKFMGKKFNKLNRKLL